MRLGQGVEPDLEASFYYPVLRGLRFFSVLAQFNSLAVG
jgi:hypothetical protein